MMSDKIMWHKKSYLRKIVRLLYIQVLKYTYSSLLR